MSEGIKRTQRSPREIFQDAFNAALFPEEARYEPVDPDALALRFFQSTKAKDYKTSRERITWQLSGAKARDMGRSAIACPCSFGKPHNYLYSVSDNWKLCPITIILQLTRIHFNGGPDPHLSFDELMKLSTGETDEMHSKSQ